MKKIKLIILVFSLLIGGSFLKLTSNVGANIPAIKTVWAEDDEDEEDEKEREDEDEENGDEEDRNDDDDSSTTEYKNIYTKLPDTILETTKEVPLHDSDMDGMYDDDDPHPYINEYIIVRDDNFNGIDDRYEG